MKKQYRDNQTQEDNQKEKNMKKRMMSRTLLVLLCPCTLLPVTLTAQNLLVNGGFENEPNWGGGVSHDGGYTALIGNQLPGWTIEANHAVTIHRCLTFGWIDCVVLNIIKIGGSNWS